jgi:hypothetical protein
MKDEKLTKLKEESLKFTTLRPMEKNWRGWSGIPIQQNESIKQQRNEVRRHNNMG